YITVDEYISAYEYPDSICNSFYPIDLHRDGMEKIYQIFLEEGKVPKIPLSALIVKGFDNLYVAGRCASGDRLAQSAFRVKASCMAMGQAAGAAAAVAVKENNASSRGCCLDHIKEILRKDGAIVP
ncbi:MAG TPA: FAD-dependent oxidoreductase, partial [Clostridiaceae bacterium]|nr:FAD-dependent oxidoreductase [Clostridiaceae bacterium]